MKIYKTKKATAFTMAFKLVLNQPTLLQNP